MTHEFDIDSAGDNWPVVPEPVDQSGRVRSLAAAVMVFGMGFLFGVILLVAIGRMVAS